MQEIAVYSDIFFLGIHCVCSPSQLFMLLCCICWSMFIYFLFLLETSKFHSDRIYKLHRWIFIYYLQRLLADV